MKYHSAIKGTELLMRTKTWTDLKCIIHNEKYSQKVIYYMFHFFKYSHKDENIAEMILMERGFLTPFLLR